MNYLSERKMRKKEIATERSSTGIIVALGVALLIILLMIFGTGIFRGNDSKAPASSGPAPADTNTTLPIKSSSP